MAVSQFMRDMSAAKSVVIEAAIHRDTGHVHLVNTRANVTDAEAADMRTTNGAHVSTSEAADMTAAKTAAPARKNGTTGHCYANHRGSNDCENSSATLGFHGLAPFSQ
jgi:hypothetical protein